MTPPLSPEQMKELEERIRELVGEYVGDRDYLHCENIGLEHCRVALRRRSEEINGRKDPDPEHEFKEVLQLNCIWKDLKPWEDQHEVHKFLFDYLCK